MARTYKRKSNGQFAGGGGGGRGGGGGSKVSSKGKAPKRPLGQKLKRAAIAVAKDRSVQHVAVTTAIGGASLYLNRKNLGLVQSEATRSTVRAAIESTGRAVKNGTIINGKSKNGVYRVTRLK